MLKCAMIACVVAALVGAAAAAPSHPRGDRPRCPKAGEPHPAGGGIFVSGAIITDDNGGDGVRAERSGQGAGGVVSSGLVCAGKIISRRNNGVGVNNASGGVSARTIESHDNKGGDFAP